MLGQIEDGDVVVLADFEAGLGTLSRMKPGQLDTALVVAEPTVKSFEVARRAVELLRERGISPVVVANRVSGPPDGSFMVAAFADIDLRIVPDDPAISDADARGLAPFDLTPDAPAVCSLRALAVTLAGKPAA